MLIEESEILHINMNMHRDSIESIEEIVRDDSRSTTD